MINRNNATQAQRGRYHILKTDPEAFQTVLSGAKTFEIRLNDRAYAVGDVLGLRETKHTGAEMQAGAPLVYTGRECQRFVSHVLTGYGLADGWCCLSFRLPHAAGESIPVPGLAVAWAAIPSRGTRAGRIYTTCDTRKEIDAYIELVHQSNDSLTLTPRPLSFADAAPQASAEARPNNDAVDLARAGMALHAPGAPEHTVCAELVRLADALKQPQADKGAAPCTCPSGDGSLRHPCPAHPQTNEGRA